MILEKAYELIQIKDKFENGSCPIEIAKDLMINEENVKELMDCILCDRNILEHQKNHLENIHCSKCKYTVVPV